MILRSYDLTMTSEFNHITDELVLGSLQSLKNEKLMKEIHATMTVFDYDIPDGYCLSDNIYHWHLWIDDDDTKNNGEIIYSYFLPSAIWIAKMTQNGKVLVHCMFGASRSATIVTAYLMFLNQWDKKTALEYVRKRHYWASPNKEFDQQLSLLEKNMTNPILGTIIDYLGET